MCARSGDGHPALSAQEVEGPESRQEDRRCVGEEHRGLRDDEDRSSELDRDAHREESDDEGPRLRGDELGTEGSADDDHRHTHPPVAPGVSRESRAQRALPHGTDHRVARHQDHRRGRGHLLAHPEQQDQQGEGQDVESRAGDRGHDATDHTAECEHREGPGRSVGEVEVHGPVVVPVHQVQGTGEGQPDRGEGHLGVGRGQDRSDVLQAQDDAECSAGDRRDQRLVDHRDAVGEDGDRGSGHADRLDHQGEVPSSARSDAEPEGHGREGDGTAALRGRASDEAADRHDQRHESDLTEQVPPVGQGHAEQPGEPDDSSDGERSAVHCSYLLHPFITPSLFYLEINLSACQPFTGVAGTHFAVCRNRASFAKQQRSPRISPGASGRLLPTQIRRAAPVPSPGRTAPLPGRGRGSGSRPSRPAPESP